LVVVEVVDKVEPLLVEMVVQVVEVDILVVWDLQHNHLNLIV
jgi:hypothetical protein